MRTGSCRSLSGAASLLNGHHFAGAAAGSNSFNQALACPAAEAFAIDGDHLNGVIRGVLYVWMIACLLVGFADGLKGAAMYGMAIAAAVGLTVLSLAHIAFQTRIAHRRPPQFNKKGAAYDEK